MCSYDYDNLAYLEIVFCKDICLTVSLVFLPVVFNKDMDLLGEKGRMLQKIVNEFDRAGMQREKVESKLGKSLVMVFERARE